MRRGALGAGALAFASLTLPDLAGGQGTITNLVRNPRAARGLTGWAGYVPSGIAEDPVRRTVDGLPAGTTCAELTFTPAAPKNRGALLIARDGTTPCAPGDMLWAQAEAQMVVASPGAELWLTIAYLDASGRVITERPLQAVTATPGAWAVLRGFDAAPARADACYLGVWLAKTRQPGSIVRASNALVVSGPPTMPGYFDGDQTGCSWTGTPHASRTVAPAPVPAAPARAGFLAGWNDNAVLQSGWSPDEDARLNADIGMSVLRVACDLRHGWLVPGTSTIDWATPGSAAARVDQLNTLCAARGIRLLPIPLGAPRWMLAPLTDPSAIAPPLARSYGDWASVCAQMATRWQANLAGIEIWNEPNLHTFWSPRPRASDYAKLLATASAAVRAAAPGVRVIVGGLGGKTTDNTLNGDVSLGRFLGQMYDAGALGTYDGMALHPYPEAPTTGVFDRSLRTARAAMAAAGDTAPLWITEIGITTTGSDGVTPDQQAAVDRLLYAMLKRQHDVQAVCWHTSVAASAVPGGDPEAGYGFVDRATKLPGPAYAAVKSELAGES